ncbi:related to retrotransposon protein [Ustilago bromivora]|uniref:Related to retrotransposon protein n=1 Tax=Ustilago bromivora TaxID=307758 RepID=A0A1K0FXF0_9BASI|nr:related to retrotransposon protein [Ustilago bromivora]
MVNNYSTLIDSKTCRKNIFTAGSKVLEATAVGDVNISIEYGDVLLQNVLYVRNLNVNLLSTNSFTDEGAQVTLDQSGGQIHLANGTSLKISKNSECGLLEFKGDTWQESAMTASTQPFEGIDEEFELTEKKPETSTQQLWHEHLGHPGRDKARAIIKKLGNKLMTEVDPDTALTCKQCIQSKSTVAQMGQGSRERAATHLDLVHIDLILDTSYVTEHTCILVLVDDHSKYVYVQPLLWKSQAFVQLKKVVSFLETQTGRRLKVIQSDKGGKWENNEARTWSQDKGIEWQKTVDTIVSRTDGWKE